MHETTNGMFFGCLFFEEANDVEGLGMVGQRSDRHPPISVREPSRDVTRAALALGGRNNDETSAVGSVVSYSACRGRCGVTQKHLAPA